MTHKKYTICEFGCCFCNNKIKSSKIDPCSFEIKKFLNKKNLKNPTQSFFCHFECLNKYLKNIKINNEEILKIICFFCNTIINQNSIYSITSFIGFDKLSKTTKWYCHINCLKNTFHDFYKNYLYIEDFS